MTKDQKVKPKQQKPKPPVRPLEKLDKWLFGIVVLGVLIVIAVNFITSYGHIFAEGVRYGERGIDADLTPIGIDATMSVLGLVNVFAGRFGRSSRWLRAALVFSVGCTIAVNAAFGLEYGTTGGLLATWSPVGLLIAVEAGLYCFRIMADVMAAERERMKREATVTVRRPRQPRTAKSSEVQPTLMDYRTDTGQLPVLRGDVDHLRDPFYEFRTENTHHLPAQPEAA